MMTLAPSSTRTSGAAGLSRAEWLGRLSDIGRNHGFFERVGSEALAFFVQEGDTLVVSFDRATRVFAEERDGMPPGFEAVQKREWSLLSILSLGDSWFRSPDLMAFFDKLTEQGFFDSFAQVIFLGFGPANGHAACAYASAAPGASVLVSSPVATLAPDRAGFERRFRRDRIRDFSRYGDAPSLVAAARDVVILFDPTDSASSAHAAQFRGAQITHAPLRFTGPAPHHLVARGGLLVPLLRALANGRLTSARVSELIRPVRRAYPPYLWRLAQLAQSQGQFERARRIADHAADVTGEARFADLAARLGS